MTAAERQARCLVWQFFKPSRSKCRRWWRTPNPMFGHISPADLLAVRGPEKVLRIVRDLREGNVP